MGFLLLWISVGLSCVIITKGRRELSLIAVRFQIHLLIKRRTKGSVGDLKLACFSQLLACVHDEEVTYVATSNVQDLVPPNDIIDDPSPLLTPEPLFDHEDARTTNHRTNPISVVVHNTQQVKRFCLSCFCCLIFHVDHSSPSPILLRFHNGCMYL